ncbi:MAG: hypothetical protein WKF89_19985 [Chitinophagaceae bacterium]
MPKWMTVVFALFLSLHVFSTEGRNVEEVIHNYVLAMGGKERLHSIHSIYTEGMIIQKNKANSSFKAYALKDKAFHTEVISGTGIAVISFSGKSGWKYDGIDSLHSFTSAGYLLKDQAELDCSGPLVDYITKGHHATLLGTELVAGKDCYRVKLTRKTGQWIEYFIDIHNFLIMRERASIETSSPNHQVVTRDFSNYRLTKDGYVFAYTIKTDAAGTMIMYNRVELNKPVYPGLYKPSVQ